MANKNNVYLFWDNSNIYGGAQETAKRLTPTVKPYMVRIYFANLVSHVVNGRTLAGAFCGGSIPPDNDDVWRYVEQHLGRKPILFDRIVDAQGKEHEQGVDERILLDMLETICDVEPATLALLTGDGARHSDSPNTGFLPNLKRATKLGWDIEVYSWSATMNRYMREFAEANGKYVCLDDDFYSLTFVPAHDGGHERKAKSLFGQPWTR